MRVLVTGGAGYIGSVVAAQLVAAGHEVTVLDDLSTGHADAVPAGAGFVKGTLRDCAAEVLAAIYIAPQVALAAPFLVLLVALWIRPWGIFGSREELERV